MWLFWVDNEAMPRNENIKQLLMSKTHLIDGPAIPISYIQFLEHHNAWTFDHLRWRNAGIPYSWHSKVNWPDTFEDEVFSTFMRLKEKHAAFLEALAGDRRSVSQGHTVSPRVKPS
jgi:hypothetical protein